MKSFSSSPLLDIISGKTSKRIPIWLMRQAGRYLPEYLKLRKKGGSFLSICLNPDFATEITLQPLKRYDLDAAIIFSDILTIPMALGKKVIFKERTGPEIERIKEKKEIENLEIKNMEFLEPAYETLRIANKEKQKKIALIGFAGAPFTLACYMLQGNSRNQFSDCVSFFKEEEKIFIELLEKLSDSVALHLINQIKAGAEVIQIFDSHAKVALGFGKLKEYCIDPVDKIIKKIRKETENAYIISFPRNIGRGYADYVSVLDLDCISLDQYVDTKWAVKNIKIKNKCYQGNLDPKILLQGGEIMEKEAKRILSDLKETNHIFNLGHGVMKQTDPGNISDLINIVRSYEK